jgi:hypothetical protein
MLQTVAIGKVRVIRNRMTNSPSAGTSPPCTLLNRAVCAKWFVAPRTRKIQFFLAASPHFAKTLVAQRFTICAIGTAQFTLIGAPPRD